MSRLRKKYNLPVDVGTVVVVFMWIVILLLLLQPTPPKPVETFRAVIAGQPRVRIFSERISITPHRDPRVFALPSSFGFSPQETPLELGHADEPRSAEPLFLERTMRQTGAQLLTFPLRASVRSNPMPFPPLDGRRSHAVSLPVVEISATLKDASFTLPAPPPDGVLSPSDWSMQAVAWVACSTSGVVASVFIDNSSGSAAYDRAVEMWLYRGQSGAKAPVSGRITVELPGLKRITSGVEYDL